MTTTALRLAALLAVLGPAAAMAGERGDDLPLLDPLAVALLQHEWARTTAPEDKLVQWFGEVCGELDPAARAEAAKAARVALKEAAHRASFTSRWRVPVRQTLGGYDLTRGGFPTSLRDGAVIRFGPASYCGQDLSYLVVFENGKEHDLVTMPRGEALDFVRANPEREVVHEVEIEVTGAQPTPEPALRVRIVRVRTVDARRQTLVADSGAGR